MCFNQIKTVFSATDFYLVVKPAGKGFHDEVLPNERRQQGFFNLCCEHFNEKLFPVHRLDKMTSGLMILARNQEAAAKFTALFEQKLVEKLYIAMSDKKPKKKQGSIIGGMQKARSSKWMLTKSKDNLAVSRFFSWGISSEQPGLRLFLIKPETGKTHQIRVALKSLGSPILGDALYGGRPSDRGYLHAFALKFVFEDKNYEFYEPPEQGVHYSEAVLQQVADLDNGFELNWPKSNRN
mgnify:CR=1 FL=1